VVNNKINFGHDESKIIYFPTFSKSFYSQFFRMGDHHCTDGGDNFGILDADGKSCNPALFAAQISQCYGQYGGPITFDNQ
jgi:hypothetical protein